MSEHDQGGAFPSPLARQSRASLPPAARFPRGSDPFDAEYLEYKK